MKLEAWVFRPGSKGERVLIDRKQGGRHRHLLACDYRALGAAVVDHFGGPDGIPWGASAVLSLRTNGDECVESHTVNLDRLPGVPA